MSVKSCGSTTSNDRNVMFVKKMATGNRWGPGPARYQLPTTIGNNNHDVSRKQAPAHSFGIRRCDNKSDGPGPAYMVDGNMTSRGKENRPSFSLGGRLKKRDPEAGPGPGAYNTDNSNALDRRAPLYSISPRTRYRGVDKTPAPNTYSLPSTLGNNVPNQRGSQAATIYGKPKYGSFAHDWANTPGPAQYGAGEPSKTKRQLPMYSIGGRNFLPGPKMNNPGPGTYNPENVHYHLKSNPKFAFGVRHSDCTVLPIPLADVVD